MSGNNLSASSKTKVAATNQSAEDEVVASPYATAAQQSTDKADKRASSSSTGTGQTTQKGSDDRWTGDANDQDGKVDATGKSHY